MPLNFKSSTLGLLFLCGFISCQQNNEQTDGQVKIQPISKTFENSSLPYLVRGSDNILYLSMVRKKGNTVVLEYSILSNGDWTVPTEINSGTNWFVNWADYPMMAVNRNSEKIAHFLAKSSSGTFSYDVNVVRSLNAGNWSDPLVPHNDKTLTEHGFVTMIPLENRSFQLAWLDGRYTGGGDHGSHGGGAMTIRSAIMDMEGNLSEEVELDNRVCDCCQTGGAMTSNGPVIVYRD